MTINEELEISALILFENKVASFLHKLKRYPIDEEVLDFIEKSR